MLLLSVFEGVASSLHWEGAPLWRFAATPRDVERYYYDVGHLLEEVRSESGSEMIRDEDLAEWREDHES